MSQQDKIQLIRTQFQQMDREEQRFYLTQLSKEELRCLYQHPEIFLFDKQIIPDGEWSYFLLRCGRGFGKSLAASAWAASKIRQGTKIMGVICPTYDDVEKTMVPFILSWFLPDELEKNPYVDYTIYFKNGAKIYCYSSEVEKKGPNLEYLVCDEIATWCQGQPIKIKERFEDITRAVRVGKHPQTLITSTPKTHPFFLNFQDKIDNHNPAYRMLQGSMLDNPFLSEDYKQLQINEYGHNARGRQEIYGDLITEAQGAFFSHKLIDDHRSSLPAPITVRVLPRHKTLSNAQLMGAMPLPEPIPSNSPYLVRIVIGFDPALSVGGDECGIIVAALYSNKQAYVIEDASDHYDPATYSKKIADLYHQYDAAAIVVETNAGGNAILYALRSVNANMKIIGVHTHQGKTTRAEHIASLYSQGKVHHTKIFKELEDQMCSFSIDYLHSPDRLDSLSYALTELFFPTAPASSLSFHNLPTR